MILYIGKNKFLFNAKLIFGTSFDIKDILCYLIGTIILFVWEKFEKRK